MQPTVVGEIHTPMDVAKVEFTDPRELIAVSLISFSLSKTKLG